MSAQHTQGKLVVLGTRLRTTHTGIDCMATMQVSNRASWEEDAHRLAACWNACENIADPENAIPRLLALNEINPVLSGQVATLRKQNAELLAALRHINGAAMDITCDRRSIREAAQAAINDAEGGAA